MTKKLKTFNFNNSWARLFSYLKPHKTLVITAFIGLCLFSLIDAGMIYFIKPLIDNGLSNSDGSVLIQGAALVVAVFFFRGIASFISNYSVAYISTKITCTIRQEAFNKLQKLRAAKYRKLKFHESLRQRKGCTVGCLFKRSSEGITNHTYS